MYNARMNQYDVIIIGAGAAGLMCAIQAASRGRRTLVIDHANKAGKKILMSGGGRCNFTNIHTSPANYISHNPHFCKSALSRYTPWHFIEWVQQHNIAYHEKTLGQLFCDHKSKDIVHMLLDRCETASAEIKLSTSINKVSQLPDLSFSLKTNNGNYHCKSLVVASGGLSIPTMGASPFGFKIAEQFNIPVYPTRAGLVPFTLHDHDKQQYVELSGISTDCTVTCNQQSFRENMLFTHRGLSGPAMLQISSYWRPGDTLTINCLPDRDLASLITNARQIQPKILVKNWLTQWLTKKLVECHLQPQLGDKPLAQLSKQDIHQLVNTWQCWQIKPNNTEGYRTAEVTLGGIDCDYLSSKTFEANTTKNLYFIGEVVDVTGWLGGYNFQWAWASGYCAGQVV